MVDTWLVIFGTATIAPDGEISHIAPPEPSPSTRPTPPVVPYSLVRSSREFEQGIISWEAKLGDPAAACQVALATQTTGDGEVASPPTDTLSGAFPATELFAGLNILGAPYGFAARRGSQWTLAGGAGHGVALPTDEWITLSLVVRGSSVELKVNGVRAITATQTIQKGPVNVYLQSASRCAIRNVEIRSSAPICFVVMQFTDEYNALFKEVIRPVCASYGYEVIRGDDFYTSGQIIEDITRSIRESALIIADVTPDNANVFYEVGYAHGIGKPTILLSDRKRDKKLPFDIAGFRTLFYDNTISGKGVVEERLKKHLDGLRPGGTG
jgi:hypothetical protein